MACFAGLAGRIVRDANLRVGRFLVCRWGCIRRRLRSGRGLSGELGRCGLRQQLHGEVSGVAGLGCAGETLASGASFAAGLLAALIGFVLMDALDEGGVSLGLQDFHALDIEGSDGPNGGMLAIIGRKVGESCGCALLHGLTRGNGSFVQVTPESDVGDGDGDGGVRGRFVSHPIAKRRQGWGTSSVGCRGKGHFGRKIEIESFRQPVISFKVGVVEHAGLGGVGDCDGAAIRFDECDDRIFPMT